MLKKMRWRFVFAAMAAFGAVILILLLVINLWNAASVAATQDEMLLRILDSENGEAGEKGEPPAGAESRPEEGESTPPVLLLPGEDRFSLEVRYMIRFFSVRLGSEGEVKNVNQDFIASVSEEDAVSYANEVLKSGSERGYYGGYRYLVSKDEGETTVLFLNSERELESVSSLLLITLAIAGGCLAVVFLLVVLFSRRAISPYVRNLETQKQFITNAGHELKTPLTSIATSADVLAMEDEHNEWIENIRAQCTRLSKLVTNLVTLSRLDEGNPFPEKYTFSLSDAVWETAESFVPLMGAKGRAFTEEIEDGLALYGDQAAVQQTVSILLDNALKYSPERGTVKLKLKKLGKKSELTVFNTLPEGSRPEVKRLFERFYRGDASHSTKTSGTGIGLSIASASVKALGGKIYAENTEDGIVFHVIL